MTIPALDAKRSPEYLMPKPSLVAIIKILPAWILPNVDASIANDSTLLSQDFSWLKQGDALLKLFEEISLVE